MSTLTAEQAEDSEAKLFESLALLDQYDYASLGTETEDDGYYAEVEARAGKDREFALAVLVHFISSLQHKEDAAVDALE